MIIKEVTDFLETIAPLSYQESYDNSGLIIGNYKNEIKGILISFDCTEDIIKEAISKNCNLIISHHPLIFSGIKKINGNSFIDKIIISAIKNDISIYAIHTNIDNIITGVNKILCDKLNLINHKIMIPQTGLLRKLITFCPDDYAEKVRQQLFEAGAGHIGNYNSCSYNTVGYGTFKALDGANPFVGEKNNIHKENETKIEVIYSKNIESRILNSLFKSHPYEEVAYDIIQLENEFKNVGSGMIAELNEPINELEFLTIVKQTLNIKCIKHSELLGKKIKKVALCAGSGSFLIKEAKKSGADIFLTADIKYHQFFEAENMIIIADIGHYESEQFIKELLFDILSKKFANFAILISENNTNPIMYF